MSLKPGDKVSFIDEVGDAVILEVKGDELFLHREDGFDEWVPRSWVVKRNDEEDHFPEEARMEDVSVEEVVKEVEPVQDTEDPLATAKFKPGDKVSFIDEPGEAVVIRTAGREVLLRSETDFDEWVDASYLVKQGDLKVDKVITKDRPSTKKDRPDRERKEKHILEVDLHIHELVDYPLKMSNYDMLQLQLETARNTIDKARKSFIKRVILIHGVGEGKLRSELHQMLSGMDNLTYHDASFLKYGAGATEVELWNN